MKNFVQFKKYLTRQLDQHNNYGIHLEHPVHVTPTKKEKQETHRKQQYISLKWWNDETQSSEKSGERY